MINAEPMNGESVAAGKTPAVPETSAEPSTENPSTVAETAGATDATAAQSTEQQPSLLGSLLEQMDLPEGIKKPEAKVETTKEEEPQVAEPTTEEVTEPEAAAAEEKPESSDEDEDEKPVAEEKKRDWLKFVQEEPEKAAQRLREEIQKRKTRTGERNRAFESRDQLVQENEALKKQLQNASRPVPTRENPLADIEDKAALQQIKKQSSDLKEFAKLTIADWENLEKEVDDKGVEKIKVMVGDKEQLFSKRQLADMELQAERTLSEQIPDRIDYLNKRSQINDATYTLYPDLKNESSDLSVGVRQILQDFPEIKKSPEFLYWVANAVSRDLEIKSYLASKKNGTTDAAKKVVAAAKVQSVPAPVRSGISVSSRKVDSETARKRLIEGSEETGDLEALIASKLQGSRSGVQVVQT